MLALPHTFLFLGHLKDASIFLENACEFERHCVLYSSVSFWLNIIKLNIVLLHKNDHDFVFKI